MHALSILIVLLIGGTFIVGAALIPLSPERGKCWRRWLTIVASCLLVIGATGFFGSALSAAGGLNWLPSSFEWPVGYATGVVSNPEGGYVVPHSPSGRIQVYDTRWTFLAGWHVDAGGGIFKVLKPKGNRIEVITVRGQWHYVFDTDGRLISKDTYRPQSYAAFPDEGMALVVPTAPWLWTFSHPGFLFLIVALGMVIFIIMKKTGNRMAAS